MCDNDNGVFQDCKAHIGQHGATTMIGEELSLLSSHPQSVKDGIVEDTLCVTGSEFGNGSSPNTVSVEVKLAAVMYCLGFFSSGMMIASLGPALLALREQTNSSIDALSLCFVSRSVGYLIGSIGGGSVVDRFPGHPCLAAMLALGSLGTSLIPFVSDVRIMGICIVSQGFAMGGLDTIGNVLLIWQFNGDPGPWMQVSS